METKKRFISDLEILAKYYRKNNEQFRSNSYYRAISILKSYKGPLTVKDILKLKGIGKGISKKLAQLLKDGYIRDVEAAKKDLLISRKIKQGTIKKKTPREKAIDKLAQISWIGNSTAKKLYDKGFHTITQLHKGGTKYLSQNQQIMLKYHSKLKTLKRSFITLFTKAFEAMLIKHFGKRNFKMLVGGSYRRGSATSGDIDIVVMSKKFSLNDIIQLLHEYDVIVETLSHGKNEFKCIGRCAKKKGIFFRLDILFTTKESWPTAALAYTGNAALNREMRFVAKKKGLKLSQHGLFKGTKQIPVKTERQVFKLLDLKYIKPSDRG